MQAVIIGSTGNSRPHKAVLLPARLQDAKETREGSEMQLATVRDVSNVGLALDRVPPVVGYFSLSTEWTNEHTNFHTPCKIGEGVYLERRKKKLKEN